MQEQEPPKSILKKPKAQVAPTPAKLPVQRRVILPSSLHHQKKKQLSCRSYCKCCVCLFLIILLLATFAGLFYLWFAPKLPVFKLKPVQFTRFVATPGADGTASLQTGSNVWVEVKNPNSKLVVYYSVTQMQISTDDVELGSTSLPEFSQTSGELTMLRFMTRSETIVDEETGKRLNGTVKSDAVKLNVEVKTKVGFGFGKFRSGMVPIDVKCGGVSLKKVKDDGPLKCRVNWFGW